MMLSHGQLEQVKHLRDLCVQVLGYASRRGSRCNCRGMIQILPDPENLLRVESAHKVCRHRGGTSRHISGECSRNLLSRTHSLIRFGGDANDRCKSPWKVRNPHSQEDDQSSLLLQRAGRQTAIPKIRDWAQARSRKFGSPGFPRHPPATADQGIDHVQAKGTLSVALIFLAEGLIVNMACQLGPGTENAHSVARVSKIPVTSSCFATRCRPGGY